VSNDRMAPRMPRRVRRLSDHIMIAFHHACDQGDLEVAGLLLKVLEMMIAAPRLPHPGGDRRRETETLVAAHERLWPLRHPEPVE
jgi:hypothetical protein